MYDYFKGQITELTPTYAVIECGGVGYLLMISLQTFSELDEQSNATLYAHLYNLPNDLPVMYGFGTKKERQIFKLLIGVSGVGGNTARTILSTFNPQELKHIITSRDVVRLKSVKGLGVKTSEKVIIELVDKISNIEIEGATTDNVDMALAIEAVSALQMLGFNKGASEKVVNNVMKANPNSTIENIIKLSLKMM